MAPARRLRFTPQMEEGRRRFALNTLCAPLPLKVGLEDEPPADLHAARLEDVGVARHEAEVDIVEIQVRYPVTTAVEQVEELEAQLEEGRLGELGLLHDAQILGHEGLGAQAAVRRRGVAEEKVRVRVEGGVGRVD